MFKLDYVAWGCTVALAVTSIGAAYAQNYPTRPIRIVTSPVGGGNDISARIIAAEISAPLGQQVIVDNRSGGVVPGDIVAKSPPNGYTLLAAGGTFTLGPLLQKTPYDVLNDFIPIVYTGVAPNIVIVNPNLPVKSIKELIALAKAKPGQLNYSSAGAGAQTHLAGELFKSMSGTDIVRIPFGGNGPAIASVLSGDVQIMIPNPPTANPHIKSGKVRPLAVTSLKPSALAPGLPTVSESGLPGYEVLSIDYIFAPAKTPSAIINRLNREIAIAVNKPEIKQRYFNLGVETVGAPPDETLKLMRADIAKWAKVVNDAGIKGE